MNICDNCGKIIPSHLRRPKKHKFCDQDCYTEWIRQNPIIHRTNKPVRCITTGKCYRSIKHACHATGISKGSLIRHLNQGSKMRCGLQFERIHHAAK